MQVDLRLDGKLLSVGGLAWSGLVWPGLLSSAPIGSALVTDWSALLRSAV